LRLQAPSIWLEIWYLDHTNHSTRTAVKTLYFTYRNT
jgi:hypothetical protein